MRIALLQILFPRLGYFSETYGVKYFAKYKVKHAGKETYE